jgi:hypothetical protein
MTDIAIQLILIVEIKYRESVLHSYQWRIKRKAQLEEEQLKRKLEAELTEKERQKRMDQARVSRLLKDAVAFQQAGEIRKYVEAVSLALSHDASSTNEEVKYWSQWALAQAIATLIVAEPLVCILSSAHSCLLRTSSTLVLVYVTAIPVGGVTLVS